MKILLIDNYDSFVYNIYQYLLELGNDVDCVRNNTISLEEIERLNPDVIFISPGPGTPSEAGICIEVIKKYAGKKPIFGVCLGLQAIGEAFGGKIVYAKNLYHGKTSKIISLNKGIMDNFQEEFIGTRYHSLVIERETLPDCLEITCETDDGEIMGVKHREFNIEGVQFHPESIMTEKGKDMLKAFLDRAVNYLESYDLSASIDLTEELDTNVEVVNLKDIKEVTQYAISLKNSENSYDLFKKLQYNFGPENSCILESVNGPLEDCGNSYIGVFPRFEIIIRDRCMSVKTKKSEIKNLFIENFHDMYDFENDIFYMGKRKFSDIFLIIKNMFKINKRHDINININHGLIGYFSYDYLHYLERIESKNKDALNLPDVHLRYYASIIHVLKETSDLIIINNCIDEECNSNEQKILGALQNQYQYQNEVFSGETLSITQNMKKEDFLNKVEKAKRYISEGDIFQVQIGRRLCINKNIHPLSLYKKLRDVNPSPYMFYWDCGDYQLISNSPELQLRVEELNVKIRPIAGTSKGKGRNDEEKEKLKNDLINDKKEQAEHIMLVDLARNDIGRVAIPGTVKVSKLIKAEEFSHVFHLISNVEGKISNKANTMELFECSFPAGTLTGAPKVRAMEIIEELEDEKRGPYGGAFGIFDFNGNIISSIIIRTVLRKEDYLYLHASAGIVADSSPESEWNEIDHKTAAIKKALDDLR